MEEVDRLFECFKCGFSPPQSAFRERKRRKSKLKHGSSPSPSGILSPGSAGKIHEIPTHLQLSIEKSDSPSVRKNRRKQFSPIVFYGSPHGVPPKRPSSLLQLLHQIRVDLTEQNKFSLRKEIWATFPRQDEAIKFAKGHEHVHVFSYQDHFNGQRRFLVSTYKYFWQRYKNMDSKFRHHYEVIQEGLPCHLYFDLEFNRRVNIDNNEDEMIDLLLSIIFKAFHEKYSIQGNLDWIVELDSSTEEKFSRHLIIRIPKAAFKDNSHAGAFVAEICSRILIERQSDGRFDKLFVKKDSSSTTSSSQLFVDTAVYSRNRCFRLALSSKAGKSSVLLPTGRFKCKDMVNHNFATNCVASQEFPLSACTSDLTTTYFLGKSPFPALDKFVESIASIGNVSGKIQSWYWFSEYGLMVYSMSRNRYCERIGRQHKSNHVMYIVDLRRAVYYQKCHDPDCRGYRSPLRLIPDDITPDPSLFFDSNHTANHGGPTLNNPDHQFLDNDEKNVLLHNDENFIDSFSKDSWWLEASRVAEDIENKKNSKLSNMETIDDEDDEWWMAVERTASQAELNLFN
ncbi:hypothetical protein I3842_05G254500 [Carya illinoinensis]|uniref:DNA-directed primase/polymerase protein n=1 Tax=Carya illinoinensis TaxID=32201 RepID=A0A922JST3_CARIL|nr:hypothetical protein I3842_05G254500 [Carya illinoinensis]